MISTDKNMDASFPIVAIGASAGGLHPLQCFLSFLPKDFGFSVVFMQHLSLKHKSLLAELLNKARPDLEILEVSDNLQILPGKIYLCPPGQDVRVSKGAFNIALLPEEHVHLPIDEFFSSLSEEAGERVIGVIFSGAGTDGARGIQEIRTGGGTVFVQDPATSEFASMPLAAIATGQADGVFKPEEIAREILKMHGAVTAAPGPSDLISPVQFEDFYRLLHDKAGYNFNHYKKSVIARRINRRMYLRGVSTVNDYLKFISEKSPEINHLAFDLMIGVTSFFRDPLAWKALRTGVIRKLASANDDSPVRVWTPASATGEEAYSIAMMLHRELELAGRRREIQVFATDVNERALEKAREGKYPAGISSEIPPDFMKKYFTYAEDGLSAVIGKEIRGLVVFAKHDILTDPPFSRLDLVICRNLLIYLEPEAQEKCIALFHYALKNGGFLFLGNAESPGKNIALFKSLAHKKCRIYEKVATKPSGRMPISVPFAPEKTERLSLSQKPEECRQSVTGIVQEALLEGYAPAAVAVNQSYDILYHNGPTNRYLCQPRGAPTQNLLELVPSGLRNRIRSGFYRAANDGKHISIRAKLPCDDGQKREVTISISHLRQDIFLFVFKEKRAVSEYPEETRLEAAAIEETAVRQLETELAATRQDLQSNIEQLKSLNEEMQSSNEELQAANEELETSREELQSLNEELITVNAQLQTKVEEQESTNNDLNNFLASTNIPTVFLDHQFRVKRFTPAMSRLIKLIPTDLGRPIIDMSQEGLGPELIADARSVLDNLAPIKKELLMSDAWYVRTTLPYRTSDNRIEGVVITYSDVTELKRVEEALRKAHGDLELRVQERTKELTEANAEIQTERQRFYDVLEMLPAYVVLLTPDYNVPFANRFFRERFGESCGKRCYEHLFERKEPCEICETYTVLKTDAPHHWEWTGPDGRNYDIFDFPFTDTDGSPLIMEVGIDITERKQAEEGLRKVNETLEQRVTERTEELRANNEELTRFNRAMEGRELRMIELKKEINELCILTGLARRYSLDFEEEG